MTPSPPAVEPVLAPADDPSSAVEPTVASSYRIAPAAHQAALSDHERLAYLRSSGLLDGASSSALDRLTRIAGALIDVPVALVSLVDDLTQHFPGLTGLSGWAGARRSTSLSHSFCQHVVATSTPLCVTDARRDPLVANNLAVAELGVAAYAAVPLRTRSGLTLGAFCAIDGEPRDWTTEQLQLLEELAGLAVKEIEQQVQRRAAEQAPGTEAGVDPLTGLVRPPQFASLAHRALEQADAARTPVSIVSIDLWEFGAVNARYGPEVGDQMLQQTAACLTQSEARGLLAGRLHGDEFAVALPACTYAEASWWAEQLREVLAQRIIPQGPESIRCSLGVGTWHPGEVIALPPVLFRADSARRTDQLRRQHAWGERRSTS